MVLVQIKNRLDIILAVQITVVKQREMARYK